MFSARADPDGSHPLVVESGARRSRRSTLPPGEYVVHVAFGLASATKSVALGAGERVRDGSTLAAGALRIPARQRRQADRPAKLSLAIYVPERNNPEAKLVYSKARAGDVIGVPEGAYHIVSTYLDTVGVGSLGVGQAGAARQRADRRPIRSSPATCASRPARSST